MEKIKKFFTKKNVIIILVIFFVILISLTTCKIFKKNIEPEKNLISSEIKIEGLNFKNGTVVKNGDLYTYSVEVENSNKKDYKMKYFVFDFYYKNDNKIASSIRYASNVIKKGQKVKRNSNVDIDLTGAKKITITIE